VDAKIQLFSKAALMLDSSSDKLEMKDGTIYVGEDSSRRMNIEDLFRGKSRMGPYLEDLGEFIGRGSFGVSISEVSGKAEKSDEGRTEVSVTSSAAAALVSVNRETGHIKPLRLTIAVDVGKAINPTLALEQIRGGAFMGLSTALAEELVIESGRVVNPDYKDYKILSALDACVLEPLLIEKPSPEGPYGAKGIGEIPTVSIASAIGNAVCNATGVRFRDLPLTAEKVLSGLKASGR
jgi:CO/xanthine dehydrogenase Mo-binding subunit